MARVEDGYLLKIDLEFIRYSPSFLLQPDHTLYSNTQTNNLFLPTDSDKILDTPLIVPPNVEPTPVPTDHSIPSFRGQLANLSFDLVEFHW